MNVIIENNIPLIAKIIIAPAKISKNLFIVI